MPSGLELISRALTGSQQAFADDLLDNITFTWLTNTGVSSGRLYWENTYSYFGVKGVSIPVAVSALFPTSSIQPRGAGRNRPSKLIHYNRLPVGGHFAAFGRRNSSWKSCA